MSTLVISLPADEVNWGPVVYGATACVQTATVMQAGRLACLVTVQWPTPMPCVAVTAQVDGRHAGPKD